MSSQKAVRPTARDAIIEAAIGLLSVNPGATMSELALRAGVGRATLHRHFRDRDALLVAIEQQCIRDSESAVLARLRRGSPAIEQLHALFTAMIPFGDRYHFLKNLHSGDAGVIESYQRELEWLLRLVTRLKREGVVASDVPDAWLAAQIDQLVWTGWSEVAAGRLAAAEAPELAVRTLLGGLGSDSRSDYWKTTQEDA